MAQIKVSDSVIPSKVDTPLDARSRVDSESDILNITNAYVGQLVYCVQTGAYYVVTALKEKSVGSVVVQKAAVAEYKALSSGGGGLSEAEKEELLDELEDRLLNGEWGAE